jgi:hypothetical protein
VDLLGRRVIVGLHDLAQDLQALMRRLQARALTNLPEFFNLAH